MEKIENLTFEEKLELIKAAPVQLYKGEELIKLYYLPDSTFRLLIINKDNTLFYAVKEQLIVFNDELFKQVNEGFSDVIYGVYQQVSQDGTYCYSYFDSLEKAMFELQDELKNYVEGEIK